MTVPFSLIYADWSPPPVNTVDILLLIPLLDIAAAAVAVVVVYLRNELELLLLGIPPTVGDLELLPPVLLLNRLLLLLDVFETSFGAATTFDCLTISPPTRCCCCGCFTCCC